MPGRPGSLADHVCLAAIAEGPTHGWAVVKLLRPDGDLGRIWSLSRPLTYRSIDRLADAALIARRDAGRRTELRITPAGRRCATRWRTEPVGHVRDLRTEFLLKLRLLDRSAIDPAALIERQRAELRSALESLTTDPPTDPVGLWRQESALAAQRFLDRIGEPVVSDA
jgi:DNA-binding PadR family transcriptional regulator